MDTGVNWQYLFIVWKGKPEDTSVHWQYLSIVCKGKPGDTSVHWQYLCLTGKGFAMVRYCQWTPVSSGNTFSLYVKVLPLDTCVHWQSLYMTWNRFAIVWYCQWTLQCDTCRIIKSEGQRLKGQKWPKMQRSPNLTRLGVLVDTPELKITPKFQLPKTLLWRVTGNRSGPQLIVHGVARSNSDLKF